MGKRRIDAHRRRRGEEPLVRAQFWIRTTQGKEIKKEKKGRKKGKGGRRWKRQAAASALYKNETEKKIKREINEKMKKK